ncbi:flagellar biosynthetic protein FliQ [Rhodopila sp.]|uniref:flagellar biosynthetic protein FliQ n=1 Tax=Rhodopila sp. TaxID=2480087 RepID=UPI002C20401B|nr:flagellar biosynthetic protein FliQ [Rhodopila sp.]HVZ09052.1 flagellar biosynthetic protein FliQ [Rhodopila sp.]
MTGLDVAGLIRECMIVIVKLGGPPLVVGLLVGLVISFIQAITQINEASLAFLPKIVAIGIAMLMLGPFMAATLVTFTHHVMDRLVAAGGL